MGYFIFNADQILWHHEPHDVHYRQRVSWLLPLNMSTVYTRSVSRTGVIEGQDNSQQRWPSLSIRTRARLFYSDAECGLYSMLIVNGLYSLIP